ncbi:hypothetical protein I3U85_13725 [Mycobacteroides abscessus subsp. abscessus]|uniref:5-methylcytosine restriction system specificity protein McrC n=1 Tax=Mycobacteroides abscessus TaxID=36809 RepID=UPI0019D01FAC|nr:hypothetical protein [Mycobacteroides abscessus]MBN7535251.1 hypothetical protein [Mycobacteroides abscessus subsp. abscessus]
MTAGAPDSTSSVSVRPFFVEPVAEYEDLPVSFGDVHDEAGVLDLDPGVLGTYVTADYQKGRFRLRALGGVGVIRLNARVVVCVRPRFQISSLTHMVSACGYEPTAVTALREYDTTQKWTDWMRDLQADALLAAVGDIGARGLLRDYRSRSESSSFPHGRINVGSTIMRHRARGVGYKARYSWFERTADNLPNRLIKAALVDLWRHYQQGPLRRGVQRRIGGLLTALHQFVDVTGPPQRKADLDRLTRWNGPIPANRSYYRSAVEIARAVLTRRGVDLDRLGTGYLLPSLVIHADELFELFVRSSLQREFARRQIPVAVLDGNLQEGRLELYENLNPDQSLPAGTSAIPILRSPQHAEPDLVFRTADGRCPLVGDVKYTNIGASGYTDRKEVEQVVVYGHRYRSPLTLTVHPATSGESGLFVAGRIGDVTVLQYRCNLNAADLDVEMSRMAARLAALLGYAGDDERSSDG